MYYLSFLLQVSRSHIIVRVRSNDFYLFITCSILTTSAFQSYHFHSSIDDFVKTFHRVYRCNHTNVASPLPNSSRDYAGPQTYTRKPEEIL